MRQADLLILTSIRYSSYIVVGISLMFIVAAVALRGRIPRPAAFKTAMVLYAMALVIPTIVGVVVAGQSSMSTGRMSSWGFIVMWSGVVSVCLLVASALTCIGSLMPRTYYTRPSQQAKPVRNPFED